MNTVESPSGAKKPGGFALWAARLQMAHGRKLVIALPYLWLILLFMLPFLIVFSKSCRDGAGDPSLHRADGVGGRPADADA